MAERMRFLLMLGFLIICAHILGINFVIYSFFRTAEEQAKEYAKGRTQPGKIVTDKDGYQNKSKHQFWRAVDICVIKNDKWMWDRVDEYETLSKIWIVLGGRWGGAWSDCFHFEC